MMKSLMVIVCAVLGLTLGLMPQFALAQEEVAMNPVIWSDPAGVAVVTEGLNGTVIKKTADNGWGNAGAVSRQVLLGDNSFPGKVVFTSVENNLAKMLGLSSESLNNDFREIDFAIYLKNDTKYVLYREGVIIAEFAEQPYLPGDSFSIKRSRIPGDNLDDIVFMQNGVIKHILNDAVSSNVSLHVDAALYSKGATIVDARVEGEGFMSGAPIAYNQKISIAPNRQNTITLRNPNLDRNLAITLLSGPSHGSLLIDGDLLIYNPQPSYVGMDSFTYKYTDQVTSEESNVATVELLVGGIAVGWRNIRDAKPFNQFLIKQTSVASWDSAAGASSDRVVRGDGAVTFRSLMAANNGGMIGFSKIPEGTTHYSEMLNAIYLTADAKIMIFENGQKVPKPGVADGSWGQYARGDLFSIERKEGAINYLRNGDPFEHHAAATQDELVVDTSLYHQGAFAFDVNIFGGEISSFSMPYKRGYINNDSKIDIADAISVLGYLFSGGVKPGCLAAADVNGDGKVDIADAIRLLGYLFSGSGNPPEPFDSCGEDVSGLGCESFPADICQ